LYIRVWGERSIMGTPRALRKGSVIDRQYAVFTIIHGFIHELRSKRKITSSATEPI
jgi:hypothetical protein